jgi:nicotinamidase-related amidase
MLSTETTVLLLIDIQGKLARLMDRKDALFENLEKLIAGAKILGLPILLTEQYPEGLGATLPRISGLIPEVKAISKISFSCCREERFMAALDTLERRQVLAAGIETHVCVQQTALDLLDRGYEVHLAADAVSSRTAENRRIGIHRIEGAGAVISSVEAALFELLEAAGGDRFKKILKVIR